VGRLSTMSKTVPSHLGTERSSTRSPSLRLVIGCSFEEPAERPRKPHESRDDSALGRRRSRNLWVVAPQPRGGADQLGLTAEAAATRVHLGREHPCAHPLQEVGEEEPRRWRMPTRSRRSSSGIGSACNSDPFARCAGRVHGLSGAQGNGRLGHCPGPVWILTGGCIILAPTDGMSARWRRSREGP
jgi:hypothetical protein